MSGLIDKIAVLGREFTIQTEYVPGGEAKIRTLVYDGGRLVNSREISARGAADNSAAAESAVRQQHQRITETLVTRAAELQTAKKAPPPPPPKRPPATALQPAASKTPRPEIEPGSRLEEAIAIRQTIGPFGLAFARPAPRTAEGYERILESVDAALDAIRDAPTYDAIRLDEQLTMIALKSQLETWRLADRDLGMATEIWPTVESFAHHLMKINNRSDLVAFDHAMLTWAMSELGKGSISDELIQGLGGLGGRDADLDAMLRQPDGVAPMELLEILLRLMDQTLA
ncbi:MAG: hypothetical protein V2I67_02535 [Thermoanaerobaculales bacterium]|jgi:hypothetical protein|nr:hypothetical protein [Thermoanaerobaculales bacterium]